MDYPRPYSEKGSTTRIPDLSRASPLVEPLRRFFASQGIEAYFVGGLVRDALLGRTTRDVDVAVVGNAQVVAERVAAWLRGRVAPLDIPRGIIRVAVPGDSQPPAFVDINTIHGDIAQDLARRDFTVDALAVPGRDDMPGGIIDPWNGLADLETGLVRALGPHVFRDDPARLMRAPRLAVKLGFEVEPSTAAQIRADAPLVTRVAQERIREEFLKLLAEPGATGSLRYLDDLGLLCQVVPELSEARDVSQPREHYWDVFNHLLETPGQVERVVTTEPGADGFVTEMTPRFTSMEEYFAREVADGHSRLTLVKLAGLLHDIAKPATKTIEPSGRIRFFGHHIQGAEMAEAILKRLRVGRRGVELVRLMVQHHLRPTQMSQPGEFPTGKAIYRYYRDVGDAAVDTLYLNLADYLAARGPRLERDEWAEHCQLIGYILNEGREQKTPETLPKLVDGYDIMNTFGLSPGPRVGELINMVREAQANGEISTKEEAIALVRASLESGGSGA